MAQNLVEKHYVNPSEFGDINRVVRLYEQFRFGKELIEEREMVEFMVGFERLGDIFYKYYGPFSGVRRSKPNYHQDDDIGVMDYDSDREAYSYAYSDTESEFELPRPRPARYSYSSQAQTRSNLVGPSESTETVGSVIRRKFSSVSHGSLLRHHTSSSDSKSSVIKHKLDISKDIGRSRSSFTSGLHEDTESVIGPSTIRKPRHSFGDYTLDVSGSATGTEPSEPIQNPPPFQFKLSPPIPDSSTRSRSPSPGRVLDLEFHRSRSPKRSRSPRRKIKLSLSSSSDDDDIDNDEE
ncbi:hypothetical protein CANTEDRAFT_127379 [Yamadazyma tenuis ATCC 10573]|uniref:Uncharacterized protein n=2 Tax=Candida tenuis TaxID=2315449 RepID=G3BDA3_CANTC|nr:uncharacterized protein CANTEDRAFT_127379 [Yamadazyma tenuis ATCC 10573]EGV60281.1 hypothetical protein CANTEDRAFT_127379 [Yamadazyma tenuis ATCC 10573]